MSLINPHLEGGPFLWQGGPAGVLLVHGFSATSAEVRPLGKILLEQGFTVAGPLLPGHGTAPEAMNRCRWQDWAVAADEAYRELARRCDRLFVGGESMGALLALYLASRHRETLGILAYAPALRTPPAVRWLIPILAPFVPAVPPRRGPPGVVDERWQGYAVRPTRAALQLLCLQREVGRRLAGIRQPLLIVQGRLDTTIDVRGVDELYRQIGSAEKAVHWMERSTHCVILDQELPHVADLTLRFMRRGLGGPTSPA